MAYISFFIKIIRVSFRVRAASRVGQCPNECVPVSLDKQVIEKLKCVGAHLGRREPVLSPVTEFFEYDRLILETDEEIVPEGLALIGREQPSPA
jgi:hypothetical protein